MSAVVEEPTSGRTLTAGEIRELSLASQYGITDVYVGGADIPWVQWVGDIYFKPLRFELRSGTLTNLLISHTDQVLPRHRHRGAVTAVTISGSWRYFEYDWVARPGDYVVESPGVIHTLEMKAGTEVLFTNAGPLDFWDDEDRLVQTMDVFSFLDLYVEHCKAEGLTVNSDLFY